MTLYENMKLLQERDVLKDSIFNGIISYTFLDHLKIYETFLSYRKQGGAKMQCYSNVAEDFNVSEKTVFRIVKKMDK